MATDDAVRWNARYRERGDRPLPQPHPLLLEHIHLLPTAGLAIDVASGLGADASYLHGRGLRVICVDISAVALRQLKARCPKLMAVLADLTCFHLPSDTFDVIINFHYLQRDLWPAYVQGLRPGGLLFFQTYVHNRSAPDVVNPDYVMAPGELAGAFGQLEVVSYTEGPGGRGRPGQDVASLVARKAVGQ